MHKQVIVTGAAGFVGRQLCRVLSAQGWTVLAGVRSAAAGAGLGLGRLVEIGNVEEQQDWSGLLRGCQALVHLAGRVHVMHDSAAYPLGQYLAANTEATRRLAEGAAQAGVRRFILVSTIKVSGEGSPLAGDGQVWPEDQPPAPEGPYAVSKARAEAELQTVCRQGGMEFVIVRPPLVYGPGVRANFLRLLRLVDKGWPLPLASLSNRRSHIGVGNLADFIACCLEHPAAANQIFQVADREPFSTPGLIRALAVALARPARLFPFPPQLLRAAAIALGSRPVWERLAGSLLVDTGKAEALLGWRPPLDPAEELAATATWYRAQAGRGGER
ncbi:MAG: NAD-dependent epimerase/dehydratase family protein [Desulfobulbaceae bacterium]|nr:NAD-dependent epimerase/dehydratase family protein [Desulfobulbaceae bacterium]